MTTRGELRRLPGVSADDRRLVDMTWGELRALLAGTRSGSDAPERPLRPKELAAVYRVDVKRVREWIDDGMPCIRTGDVRGLVIWPSAARTWLEANRG